MVDTQILVYAATPSPFEELASRVGKRDPHWQSSTLWRTEFRSVVLGAVRRRSYGLQEAVTAFARAQALLDGEVVPDTATILSLGRGSTCSAYDLEFVAVAQALGVRLVTNDKQILADFPIIAISPEAFAA